MVVTRRWPRPPDGALHLIGDTHFGSTSMTANRKALWAADLDGSGMLPDSVLHLIVGDFIDHPNLAAAEDAEAIAFANAHLGTGQWISAVGNHDVGSSRTVDQAAQAWGMPAGNFVRDMGAYRIIVTAPDDGIENDGVSMKPFTSTRLNWIDAQLIAAGGTPCLIVCHWALKDTVGPSAQSSQSSFTDGFSAEDDADVRALLADNANAKAWLSGHTHSPVVSPGLVDVVSLGGHNVVAVNASAPCYTGTDSTNLGTDQYTMYVTVTGGRVDVRFRNHGAGIWHVAGPARKQTWSAAL